MPEIAAQSDADPMPLVRRKRVDGRTKAARRVRELIADYQRRLEVVDLTQMPTVYATALRLAEMETIAEEQRAAALRHESVDLVDLVRLENTARRLKRDLGLEGPPPEPPAPSLESYRRKREATP